MTSRTDVCKDLFMKKPSKYVIYYSKLDHNSYYASVHLMPFVIITNSGKII